MKTKNDISEYLIKKIANKTFLPSNRIEEKLFHISTGDIDIEEHPEDLRKLLSESFTDKEILEYLNLITDIWFIAHTLSCSACRQRLLDKLNKKEEK